jgi:hypothetical protein
MAILADHAPAPATICLHPDPAAGDGAGAAGAAATGSVCREVAGADGDEAEAVLFAMVCDLEAGRLWVAPGPPCKVPFEAFDLADLLAGG